MAENSVRISVRVDDDTAAGIARVRASVDAMGRSMTARLHEHGRAGGDSFSTGLSGSMMRAIPGVVTSAGTSAGGAFSRAFTGQASGVTSLIFSNPYSASAAIAAAIALGSAAGAALAGAVTLGFGAAFVGLGVYLIKDVPVVKRAWSKAFTDIGKKMKDAATPLIPVATRAAGILQGVADEFAPHFKRAMQNAAPSLNSFLGKLGQGLSDFINRGFDPMMKAFSDLLDTIDIKGFLDDLGDAFGHLGRVVSGNKQSVADVLDFMLSLIPDAINLVADLTSAWGKIEPVLKALWTALNILLLPAITVFKIAWESISDEFGDVSDASGSLNDGLQKVYDKLKTVSDGIVKTVTPVIKGFWDGLREGGPYVRDSLVPILQDLWGVVSTLASVFFDTSDGAGDAQQAGEDLGTSVREKVIKALKALADFLTDHREDIRNLFVDGIEAALDFGSQTSGMFGHLLSDVIAPFVGAFIGFMGNIIDAAADAFGWIPGLGGKIKSARDTFHQATDGMVDGLTTVGDQLIALSGNLDDKNKKFRLKMDIKDWEAKIQTAKDKLKNKNLPDVTKKKLKGDISDLQSKIRTAQKAINGVTGKTVQIKVGVIQVPGIIGGVHPGQAHGGITGGYVGHAAGGGPRSNRTLVGENGPELVDLAPGSHVRSNPDTRRLLSQGTQQNELTKIQMQIASLGYKVSTAGLSLPDARRLLSDSVKRREMEATVSKASNSTVKLEIDSKGSDLDRVLVNVLKGAIRRYHGGNVQAALGS